MVNSLFSPLSSVLLLHSLPLLSQTSPNYHTFSLHSASPNLSFNDPSNFPEACSWGLGWLHWRPQSVSSGTHSYLVIGFCVGSTLPGPNLRQVLVFSYFGSCGSVLPTFHSLCDYPYESWKPCACSSCIFDSTVFIGSHCVRSMSNLLHLHYVFSFWVSGEPELSTQGPVAFHGLIACLSMPSALWPAQRPPHQSST